MANSYTVLVITIIQSTDMNNSIIAESSTDQTYFICLPDFFFSMPDFDTEKKLCRNHLYIFHVYSNMKSLVNFTEKLV